MEFRPDRVEVEVGSVLRLPLDVYTRHGGRQYSFNDCRNMPLNVTFADPAVVEYMEGGMYQLTVVLNTGKTY